MPEVSVLIPALRTRWLDLAIASVLAQTFQDFELIVSDDSPDDGLENVVGKWVDPRIRYTKNPHPRADLGCANRDHALKMASGRYLKFLFDDDFLYPRSLEYLVQAARASDAKIVFHGRQEVDADGRVLDQPLYVPFGAAMPITPDILFQNMFGSLFNFIGEPSNFMLDADAFWQFEAPYTIGGVPVKYMGDVALFMNFASRGLLILGLGFFGSAFRKHASQTSSVSQPLYSAAQFEWELVRRWAMDEGLISLDLYERGIPTQLACYRNVVDRFPELLPLIELAGAPGDEGYLSDEFRRLLFRAYEAMELRARGGAVLW